MSSKHEHKFSKAQYQLQSTLDDCGIKNPQGLKLLEVGFKNGTFLQACREAEIDAAGLEVKRATIIVFIGRTQTLN